jgi:hypothetical protein
MRLDPKMPNDPPACQRSGTASSSPWQVVATPVGPTGGERPQARASRGEAPSHAARNEPANVTSRAVRIDASERYHASAVLGAWARLFGGQAR